MTPNPNMKPEIETVIRRTSVVELSLVIAAAGGLMGGTAWATKISIGQSELQSAVHDIQERQLPQLKELIEQKLSGRWMAEDMRRWVEAARRESNVWALQMEEKLNLAPGELPRFEFPQVSEIRNMER